MKTIYPAPTTGQPSTDPSQQVLYVYNALGEVISTTDRNGNLGVEGTNFYRTTYGYDDRGRMDRVVSPTGTISRTVYDGLGRVISTWVGTDDTPLVEAEWSPTDPGNMTQIVAYVYDNASVGDSNLTAMTSYPGAGQDNRVSQFFYDWRNRQVAEKAGVQATEDASTQRPIFYTEYDNLNQVIAGEQYDGDGASIVDANSDGIPDKPDATLLRSRSTTSYDDQGRVFRTNIFNVDQTDGTILSGSSESDTFYDQTLSHPAVLAADN